MSAKLKSRVVMTSVLAASAADVANEMACRVYYVGVSDGELYAKLGNETMSSACLNSCNEIATLNKDQDLVDLLEEKGFKK